MDSEIEVTLDDVWVNRLAQRIGILTAQNERLQLENEQLKARLEGATSEPEYSSNGSE